MPEHLIPMSPHVRAATVLGVVYSVAGIVSFAVSGFDAFAAPRGDELLFFTVNPLQSLVHLAIGWGLVNAALEGDAAAGRAVMRAALLFAMLGLGGGYVASNLPERNYLDLNPAVGVLHLGSAVAAGATLLLGRSGADASSRSA